MPAANRKYQEKTEIDLKTQAEATPTQERLARRFGRLDVFVVSFEGLLDVRPPVSSR